MDDVELQCFSVASLMKQLEIEECKTWLDIVSAVDVFVQR
jgi:hypothetical protein